MSKAFSDSLIAIVQEKFGESVSLGENRPSRFLLVEAEKLPELLEFLKSDEACRMEFLSSLTAAEYPQYFEVIYQLYSLSLGHSLTVKTRVPKDNPKVPTATGVWPGADFPEREVYDLMGVVFTGRSELTRILLPEGFEGHPLRKDFKLPPRLEVR